MSRAALSQNYTKGSGTQVIDWSQTANITFARNGALETTIVKESVQSAKMPYYSTGNYGAQVAIDISTATGTGAQFNPLNMRNMVCWIYKPPGSPPTIIRMEISATNFSTRAYVEWAVHGEGWQQFSAIKGIGTSENGDFGWSGAADWTADITGIRFYEWRDEAATGYAAMGASDYALVGGVFLDVPTRAKFMMEFDDGKDGLYSQAGTTHYDILSSYGFVGTAAVIPTLTGQTGYETLAGLTALYDAGWAIINHGVDLYDNGGDGMTVLTAAQIESDIESGMSLINAWGLGGDGDHFTLPQGAWNKDVADSCRNLGIKTARATLGNSVGDVSCPIGTTGKVAFYCPQGAPTGRWLNLGGALQADTATPPTTAQIDQYIARVVHAGGTGITYAHDIDATIETTMDYICSVLQDYQNKGLLDVVNRVEWYNGLTNPRQSAISRATV